jgi:hypothetical protein
MGEKGERLLIVCVSQGLEDAFNAYLAFLSLASTYLSRHQSFSGQLSCEEFKRTEKFQTIFVRGAEMILVCLVIGDKSSVCTTDHTTWTTWPT